MRSISKCIFSLLLLAGSAEAQVDRWLPSGMRIGAEAGTPFFYLFSEKQNHWEVQADLDIDKFLLVADYGQATYQLDEPTYRYRNNGGYLRIGLDYNFMAADSAMHVIFLGIRYAQSGFSDQLDFNTQAVIESETGWPPVWSSNANQAAGARWYELASGIKARVFRNIYMGFTVRYKMMLKVRDTGTLRPYFVPGFGKFIDANTWGLGYYFYYRIPFRKKTFYPPRPKPEKGANPVQPAPGTGQ